MMGRMVQVMTKKNELITREKNIEQRGTDSMAKDVQKSRLLAIYCLSLFLVLLK